MNWTEPDTPRSPEFRLLVEQVGDYAIFFLDPEGRVVTWNTGAERLKGYSEDEIRGRHFSVFYPEDARERSVPERALAAALDEGRAEDYGWRVRKDGSKFWAHVVITPLWEDGELRGFGKVTQAVEEHARLNEILDRVEDAVVVFDHELRYTYVNEQAATLLGRPRAELLGRPMVDVFPEVASSQTYEELERALETQEPVSFEFYSTVFDRWLEVRIFPSESGLTVYFEDISERKARAQQLRDEKELVEQILEVSPIALAVFDADGTFVQTNARAEELFGGDDDPLVGRNMSTFEGAFYDEQGEPISLSDHPIQKVYAEGSSVIGYRHGVELDDGTRRWLSTNFRPILNDDGDVVRVVGAVEDISELRTNELLLQRQQVELDELVEDLERSNAELEQFAYIASHDLREPLRMVSSYLELLERRHGETLSDDAIEFLDFALDGSRRLQRMIDDLLAYSRVARQFDDIEPVDLGDVVEQAKTNLSLLVEQRDAEITTDDLPTVDGSETLLVQLLQNLLINAIKYSEETPRIHLSAEKRDGEWLCTVRDEGVGIDPDAVEDVFTLFYGSSADGAGIGLAICQKIVELHGGRIWVESTPGEGSTFYVTFPT